MRWSEQIGWTDGRTGGVEKNAYEAEKMQREAKKKRIGKKFIPIKIEHGPL